MSTCDTLWFQIHAVRTKGKITDDDEAVSGLLSCHAQSTTAWWKQSEGVSELRGCDARVVPLCCCPLTVPRIRFLV